MPEEEPRSAFELAMEKLRKKDLQEGREETTLTPEQKERIAEARREHEARAAEIEIMYRSRISKAAREAALSEDPKAAEALGKIEEAYRRDRARNEEEREARISRIRAGEKA